jgi:hypothetical protein
MTLPLNREAPSLKASNARPTFPLQQQPNSLFLGWGPKI